MSVSESTPRGARERVERGIYRRNGIYQVVVSQNGRTVSQSAPSLKDARAVRASLELRRHKGESILPSRVTFGEAIPAYFESADLRPATVEWYRRALNRRAVVVLHPRKLSSITPRDIVRVAVDLRAAGLADSTIQASMIPLQAILSYAVEQQWIPANPCGAVPSKSRPRGRRREKRTLSPDEITRVLALASERWRPLVTLAIFSGCRISECLGLTWADVDLQGGMLRVHRQLDKVTRQLVEPKTETSRRRIPLAPSVVSVLRRHQLASRFSQPHHPVFAGPRGLPVTHRQAQDVWARLRRKAKLADPQPRFHDLRHTAASILIADSEGDVAYVSRCLGHSRPSMTLDVYADMFDQVAKSERVREKMERRASAALGSLGG